MTREKVTLTRPFLTHTGTLTVEKPKPNLPESNMSISIPLAPNAVLTVHDGFLSPLEADALLRHTMDLPLMSNPTFALYGKPATMHRDIGFFTDAPGVEGYRYSGQIARSIPLTPALQEILERVNAIDPASCVNAILINRYKSKLDSIGAHSDDERALASNAVFCVSSGSPRIFRIREKEGRVRVHDQVTAHGQLLGMVGSEFHARGAAGPKGRTGWCASFTHVS